MPSFNSSERALTAEPAVKLRIVVPAATQGADRRHHLARTIREMLVQPRAEQGCNFVGKADRHEKCRPCPGVCRLFEDMLDLVIRDRGNDRCDRYIGRDTRLAQSLHRRQSPGGGRRAFLVHPAGRGAAAGMTTLRRVAVFQPVAEPAHGNDPHAVGFELPPEPVDVDFDRVSRHLFAPLNCIDASG